LGVGVLSFHSGKDVLPSWGPGIPRCTETVVCSANPADQAQRSFSQDCLQRRARDQTAESCTHGSAGFDRQITLDGIWQAFLTCARASTQMVGRGQKDDASSVLPHACGETAEDGM